GEVALGEVGDELALLRRRVQGDAGGQHQLAARQPRRRVLQLGDVDPPNRRRGRLGPGRQFEVELVEEALDGEHPGSYLSTGASAPGLRTERGGGGRAGAE